MSKPRTEPREIGREERTRHYTRNGIHYKILIAWQLLDDRDVRYHYVHVYRGGRAVPFRSWHWITDVNDKFLRFV